MNGRIATAVVTCLTVVMIGMGSVPASAQNLSTVKIGEQSPPIFEYIYINDAIQGGYFKKQGIDGKIVGFTAGITATQALAGGSIDVACDGFTGTVSAIAKGSPAKVIYAVNSDNTYVVVSRDNLSKPADLKGKKWAITQMGAISQTYAAMWLKSEGLPDGAVEWIPIGGTSARARALVADQVDVTLLTLGQWVRIRNQKGVHVLATLSDSLPPLPLELCAASTKLIKEHPDVVQRFVNGILDTVRAARTPAGRDEYIKIAKEVEPSSFTNQQYGQLYDYYFGEKGNPLAMDPNGGLYPEVYVNNMKSMVADKEIDAVLPLANLWDPRFVNQYLGDHGWYDVSIRKGGLNLRDLMKH